MFSHYYMVKKFLKLKNLMLHIKVETEVCHFFAFLYTCQFVEV